MYNPLLVFAKSLAIWQEDYIGTRLQKYYDEIYNFKINDFTLYY